MAPLFFSCPVPTHQKIMLAPLSKYTPNRTISLTLISHWSKPSIPLAWITAIALHVISLLPLRLSIIHSQFSRQSFKWKIRPKATNGYRFILYKSSNPSSGRKALPHLHLPPSDSHPTPLHPLLTLSQSKWTHLCPLHKPGMLLFLNLFKVPSIWNTLPRYVFHRLQIFVPILSSQAA